MGETDLTQANEFSFVSFRLLRDQQLLLNGETPVRLGSRAREILTALLERPGVVVSKEELFARVWPKQFVEEGNLKFHVAALRKALGDGQHGNRFITNVPGRGYCFVAPVHTPARTDAGGRDSKPQSDEPRHLPAPLSRIVGRTDTIVALATRLPQSRFITIVGPGGIGKTTVAVAVAAAVAANYADGVRFVDLAPLADPSLVATVVGSALGVASENAINGLISFLQNKQMLIVLDNCEHVIETAAALAEEIFRSAHRTHILATSREPLRAGGEHVHHLASLAAPPLSQELTAAQALAFPAVQLFVERAAASQDTFELTDADAPFVADLCGRLDGIPLAIEIAAGRVDSFGIAELASRLDDRLRLLMRGRRTALTRHQTLHATLEWSYQLLSETERRTLRELAMFAGIFTWNAAVAVLRESHSSDDEVFDSVTNLIAKSLVSTSVEKGVSFYRLLDTTRAYALLKLTESGERNDLARRHAQHFLLALTEAELEWRRTPAVDWVAKHRHLIDNVRAALDWAFSPSGDFEIGVALTAAAVPLWFQMSLTRECCERVQSALSALPAHPDPRREMELRAALAWSLMQTRGSYQARPAWSEVLRLAVDLRDVDYQLRSLWGLWAAKFNSAQLRDALALAERFYALAEKSPDLSDPFVGDRMIGFILHLLGDQNGARPRIERMLAHYIVPTTGPRTIRFIFEQKTTARSFLARILWLQGFPDQAISTAENAVSEAKAGNDMLTVCQVLVHAACPISILTGDLQRLELFVAMLFDYSARNALGFWRVWGRCFKGVQMIKCGQREEGLNQLRGGLEELREIQYGVYYIVFLCQYAETLGQGGQPDQGLGVIDDALSRCRRNEENWYVAELLRVKGELTIRRGGGSAADEAERLFVQSLDWARRQETPSWELRTAISLSRLPRELGQAAQNRDLLRSVVNRFTEGHETADLVAARQILDDTAKDHRRTRSRTPYL